MASLGSLKSAIFEKEERRQQYQAHILGLNAYDRHKKFVKDYGDFYGKERNLHDTLPIKTDQDTLREGYRFIRSEEDDRDPSWEQRLVKRYYDKLFKEYCIADMSQYRNGKIGLRWRTEKEVISGKGQFICGNKQCNEKDGLASYEVLKLGNEDLFQFVLDAATQYGDFSHHIIHHKFVSNDTGQLFLLEAGENKQALVKLVACKRCAEKLVYKKQKEKKQLEKGYKEKHKRKRERVRNDDDDDDDDDDADDENDRSNNRRIKGRKASKTADDGAKNDSDENFDEFLKGMFP